MNKNGVDPQYIPILFMGLVLLLLLSLVTYKHYVEKDCIDKGFDYKETFKVEEGYYQCCKRTYDEHLEVEPYCGVFKDD